jgi:hypothetical protein
VQLAFPFLLSGCSSGAIFVIRSRETFYAQANCNDNLKGSSRGLFFEVTISYLEMVYWKSTVAIWNEVKFI